MSNPSIKIILYDTLSEQRQQILIIACDSETLNANHHHIFLLPRLHISRVIYSGLFIFGLKHL